MPNGKNEPIQFTRGDAESLVKVENGTKENGDKLDNLMNKMDSFVDAHRVKHDELDDTIETNTRFRKTFIRILLWIASTSGGLGILLFIAERSGWLN